jgi:hypothetical protein
MIDVIETYWRLRSEIAPRPTDPKSATPTQMARSNSHTNDQFCLVAALLTVAHVMQRDKPG